jgi:hypothetical protein
LDPELAALKKILARLGDDLERAFNSDPERDSPEYQRARYIHALNAIAKFLQETTNAQNLPRQFYHLAIALDDLNRGVVDSLLKPSGTGGVNPGGDTRTWRARAKISLGIHALVLAGLNRKKAAKEASTKFPDIGRLATFERENPSATEIKILNWYDEFRKYGEKSRIKNMVARGIFENGQQLVESAAQELAARDKLHDFAKVQFRQALAEGLRKQA